MSGPFEFHHHANRFPLMEGEPFVELVADIKTNGQREPIVLYNGTILDGRNRERACIEAGVTPKYREFVGNDDEARDFVISANIHRRHLTAEVKRALLDELILADPSKSDRQIAIETKYSHPTVAAARKDLESTGKVLPVEKRVGKDGKMRSAKKPPVAKPRRNRAKAEDVLHNREDLVDAVETEDQLREPERELRGQKLRKSQIERYERGGQKWGGSISPDERHAAEADHAPQPAKPPVSPDAAQVEQFNGAFNFVLQYGVKRNVNPANSPAMNVAMENSDLERVVKWLDGLLKYRRKLTRNHKPTEAA
jgi:ParB-like chromosome segregation protein Spo0J